MKKEFFVIGVDGGGTKTIGVLANEQGRILKKIKTGPTNPNKVGFKKAFFNLKDLISKLSRGKERKIKIAYLGLAGGLERDEAKKEEIERKLQRNFGFKIVVEGDQKIAFFSGAEKEEGVVLIGGTGAIAMGWKGKKTEISGGWDWLVGDQGSAFWTGRMALEEVIKCFDQRSKKKTRLKELIFKKLKIKEGKDLYEKIYSGDFVSKIASVSKIVDLAAKRGDTLAKKILRKAAKELAQMALAVIKKLKFRGKFPLVFVGGMFKSKIVLKRVKKEIKKHFPQTQFIISSKEPVFGAVKMALKTIKKYDCLGN